MVHRAAAVAGKRRFDTHTVANRVIPAILRAPRAGSVWTSHPTANPPSAV